MNIKAQIMDQKTVRRTMMRISHEILEKNHSLKNLCIVGIRTRGAYLADRIVDNIHMIEEKRLPLGYLDITLHRDDLDSIANIGPLKETSLKFNVNGLNIILVDDVLFSGRTVRAAIDEILDYGRPNKIELAVLIDRGHRELPIRADFVGKNVPTSLDEQVKVYLKEKDQKEEVLLLDSKGSQL